MKLIFPLIAAVTMLLLFSGCEKVQKSIKDKQAEWVGLDRQVTIYSMDGTPVKSFEGKINIDTSNPSRIYFILDDGRSVMTNMGYIVEEK